MYPAGDAELIQIMDTALADATRRAGGWLVCRPGCSQCCTGVFRISQLDAARLREGILLLDAVAAAPIRERIASAKQALSPSFPGDPTIGVLSTEDDAVEAFESFAEDAVCPVLDPSTGICSLYSHRPMTCRTFGPPVWTADEGFGVCELCFAGAPEYTVAAELYPPPPELEETLLMQTGSLGETIVAFAFTGAIG